MSTRNLFPALIALIVFGACPMALRADDAKIEDVKKEDGSVVYELRTYTANPGKLADLHKRFRDHTMRLFEKHGMKNIGYWVPIDKPDTLIYIIAHKNKEAAARSWKEFAADPKWKHVYNESHKNGVLVNHFERQYLTPTDYSPLK